MASEDSLALPLLPSDRAIVVPACDDLALVILQGVLKLNAHLSSSARSQSFADLERLLWDMDPHLISALSALCSGDGPRRSAPGT